MKRHLIGVIHLPMLPRTTIRSEVGVDDLIDLAVREARILEESGFDGVIVENYGDKPYEKILRDPLTIAVFTVIAREVVKSTSLMVGVNALRNSGREAYSIAVAAGASFIRVNSLSDVSISDSGVLEPEALRLRDVRVNYPSVRIYADLAVKHSSSLRLALSAIESSASLISKGGLDDYLRELVLDYVERGGADALVITGLRTGEEPPLTLLRAVKKHSPVPVLAGSGVGLDNVEAVLRECDGVIVGSSIRVEGRAGAPLDPSRARALALKARGVIG